MDPYNRVLEFLKTQYPNSMSSGAVQIDQHLSPLLICPEAIELPLSVKSAAESIVRAFFKIRSNKEHTTSLEKRPPEVFDPGNTSALMSYDFHLDSHGQLRIIEVNTNASMSLIVDAIYESGGYENPFCANFRKDILKVFFEEYEYSYAGKKKSRPPKIIAIVDEKPEAQRLFAEFVFYKELFEKSGLRAEIYDAKELIFDGTMLVGMDKNKDEIDMIYNRHTDFLFESNETKALRAAMISNSCCITPHPHEYRLLADKERLVDLTDPALLNRLNLEEQDRLIVSNALISSKDIKSFESPDALWKERKRWFFKPKRSFGGKATYRGATISRTAFSQIHTSEYIAQELIPPPEITMKSGATMKYDLRFYAYRDRIQLACARVYQGQMTNTQTPGGGMAAIRWV